MIRLATLLLLASVAVPALRAQPIEPGARYALLAQHSGFCLDVTGDSGEAGATLIQFYCSGAKANQTFTFTRAETEGYFTIQAQHSQRCLDVRQGSVEDRAAVIQWWCNAAPNQQWQVERHADRSVSLRARHSGRCLEIDAASTEPRAAVVQGACHGRANQHFYLYRID